MIIKDGENVKEKEILSVLMIGQSNMCGRGNIGDVPPIVNPDCYMLRMGRWQPMSDPINVDRAISGIPYPCGVSLAGSFADGLAKHTGKKVGLIPCADGGTRASQWQPGEPLYDHAVMQYKLAERASKLTAIIWHQGESDSLTDIAVYREQLLNIFTSLRRDLGNPELPIIVGEISDKVDPKWHIGEDLSRVYRINNLLHELSHELPSFAVASAEGLTLKDDGIHFDSVSQREFGKRYLEKYINICKARAN